MAFRIPSSAASRVVRSTTSNLTAQQVRAYKPSRADIFAMNGTPPNGFVPPGNEKFTIRNVGPGLVTVGTGSHKLRSGQTAITTNVLVNADRFTGPRVTQGTLVLLKPNSGGTVELPMHIASKPANGWKRIAAQVNQDDLNVLRGSAAGVEFVVKLKFADGTTQWVNQHGTPFKNFTIAKEQMQKP